MINGAPVLLYSRDPEADRACFSDVLDTLSSQDQGTARPGALTLVHLPADPAVRVQTLVAVAVYDSAAGRGGDTGAVAIVPSLARGRLHRLMAAIGVSLGLGPPLVEAQGARTVVQFPLRLIDLSLAPDTLNGLYVLMQPSLQSKQGQAGDLIALRFDPDMVLSWVNSAAAALTVPVPNGPAEGIQWSRTLKPLTGQGGISLGRALKKGQLDKTRWLAIGDSASGWRAELTGSEADRLLNLLLTLGTQSRLDTSASAPRDARDVADPVSVLYQPQPKWWGRVGRVVAAYVVDESGKADPASFVALLASDPGLVEAAWDVLSASRFKPAMIAGKPVRQLVQQVIQWKPNLPLERPEAGPRRM